MPIERNNCNLVVEHESEVKNKIRYLKYVGVFLIFGILVFECANLTLTSKCETHLEATSALRSLLTALSTKSFELSDITFEVKDDIKQHNSTVPICRPRR